MFRLKMCYILATSYLEVALFIEAPHLDSKEFKMGIEVPIRETEVVPAGPIPEYHPAPSKEPAPQREPEKVPA